jgi:hypothetical protein
VGGSGDDVANIFVSEGFESAHFDTIDPSFSSERQTTALMGAGLIELISIDATQAEIISSSAAWIFSLIRLYRTQ